MKLPQKPDSVSTDIYTQVIDCFWNEPGEKFYPIHFRISMEIDGQPHFLSVCHKTRERLTSEVKLVNCPICFDYLKDHGFLPSAEVRQENPLLLPWSDCGGDPLSSVYPFSHWHSAKEVTKATFKNFKVPKEDQVSDGFYLPRALRDRYMNALQELNINKTLFFRSYIEYFLENYYARIRTNVLNCHHFALEDLLKNPVKDLDDGRLRPNDSYPKKRNLGEQYPTHR